MGGKNLFNMCFFSGHSFRERKTDKQNPPPPPPSPDNPVKICLRVFFFMLLFFALNILKQNHIVYDLGRSGPNMTRRGFHRTTEVIPRRPWKSKSPFASKPIIKSENTGTQAGCARGTTRYFFQSFPLCGPPVVQSLRWPPLTFLHSHAVSAGFGGIRSRFFSATRTPNSQNHSYVHYITIEIHGRMVH